MSDSEGVVCEGSLWVWYGPCFISCKGIVNDGG